MRSRTAHQTPTPSGGKYGQISASVATATANRQTKDYPTAMDNTHHLPRFRDG
ncbi:MAG: hypothetical protein HOO95_01580 [Gallionella sp.]|nr:hypothetical protein [Gallionella sp.]